MAEKATARIFAPITIILMVVIGIAALLGLGVLSAYSPELKSGNDGRAHALSRSSVGYAGLAKLLKLTGAPVLTSRGASGPRNTQTFVVLTPEINGRSIDLETFVHNGSTLIILPKWEFFPAPNQRGWVMIVEPAPTDDVLKVLPEALRKGSVLTRSKGNELVRVNLDDGAEIGWLPNFDRLQTLSGPDWTPLLIDAGGRPILVQHISDGTLVLSDPDFVNTQGLRTLAGARVAMSIMNEVKAPFVPVVFDLTLQGFERTRSLLRLMVEPPLLGATLCVLLAGLLVSLQAAIRFGAPQNRARTVALGKKALADNTAGLVRLAKREHRMAKPYAALVRADIARAIGAPRHLDNAALDGFFDRIGQGLIKSDSFSALIERAERASSPAELMNVAQALNRWKLEIIRGRS